jgi:hypothetical protein
MKQCFIPYVGHKYSLLETMFYVEKWNTTILHKIIISKYVLFASRDSAVGTATGYGLDDQGVGVRVPVGANIFTSPCCTDQLWGPPNLLSNGNRKLLPQAKAAGA